MKYWRQELPVSDLPKNQELYWVYPDDQEGFCKNQPPGYTETSVIYRMNSHGYRGTEFSEPAEFKILVSGCSHTFGIGINEEDLWCNQLAQRITGAKVYNLALGGRSPDYVVRTIYKSIDLIKPNLVMVMWPDQSRFERPADDGVSMAWWTANDEYYLNDFTDKKYQNYNFNKNQIFLDSVCAAKQTPVIAFSYTEISRLVTHRDKARDLMHDGPAWNLDAADIYWKKFQELFDKPHTITI